MKSCLAMGVNSSQLEKEIGQEFPPNEKYFGLVNHIVGLFDVVFCLQRNGFRTEYVTPLLEYEAHLEYSNDNSQVRNKIPKFATNLRTSKLSLEYFGKSYVQSTVMTLEFGNTCYCNSVLQALYFCRPFREKVLAYKPQNKRKETLLTCLSDLFGNIASQKKKVGVIAPKKFVARLRKENDVFDNYMQQDAHEFFNYLLNTIGDLLQGEKQKEKEKLERHGSISSTASSKSTGTCNSSAAGSTIPPKHDETWIHEIFEGTLTNETRCLSCETVSSKDECFLDLSVDVDQNTSITHCLRGFSSTETLCSEHKYFCETCKSKQEAQKRMRVKKLPKILALHLKRFKYMEHLHRYTKLSYRVVFPLELRLFNTSDDACNPHRLYDLVAVVVHCGSGPNRGHYISIVKSHDFWLLFDDDLVEKIEPQTFEEFYGLTIGGHKSSDSGYILFYESKT